MKANLMKKNSIENLAYQGINSQFDGLFLNLESLFQIFKFFGQCNVLRCNTMLSNEFGCQPGIGIFWVVNIDDIRIFSGNNCNAMFTHRTHVACHAGAFYFEISTLVANGHVVGAIATATVSQKLVDHFSSPYFCCVASVAVHPTFIFLAMKFTGKHALQGGRD